MASKLIRLAAVFAALCLPIAAMAQDGDPPNVLIFLIDDAAFMDVQPYGGEARTPHIQALSDRGMMFTNYHTSPLCAPTRAMLLTGLDNHLTGVSTIPEVLPPEHENQPGYSMFLEPGVTTVATRLSEAGYRTYMTGKWHLGHGDGQLPADHGFQRSLALDASGADNYQDRTYIPYYARADWFEGHERADMPELFYSSELFVDRMIEYMEADANSDAPFFAYVAFQAIHIPVQAPREYIENYNGVYDEGWHAVREARWQRARAMGLIPEDAPLAEAAMPRRWEDLSADDQALYIRSMQLNAGMLEAMDEHIGRMIAYLEEIGELDNTIIIVTSDNGPEPNDPSQHWAFDTSNYFLNYTWDLETMGQPGGMGFIGTEWALAASAPFDVYKFYSSEGGLRVPFIAAGPGITEGARTGAAAYVTDITPTLLDYADVPLSVDEFTGRSIRTLLEGTVEAVYGPEDPVGMEVSGNAALFRGDWKIRRIVQPIGDFEWRLFNLAQDPGEANDLSTDYPDLLASMIADYEAYAAEVGALEIPEGYNPNQQVVTNINRKLATRYWWVLVLAGLAALTLVGGVGWAGWRLIDRRAA